VHIYHLQTKSYSEHKALQKYYEGVNALIDGIIESYQGKNNIISSYKNFALDSYKSGDAIIARFFAFGNVASFKALLTFFSGSKFTSFIFYF